MIFFSHQLQVVNRVVRCVLVYVVHNFLPSQESTNRCFYDKPVFHDVALAVGHWVFRHKTRAIHAVFPVSDKPALAGLACGKCNPTIKTTKLLIAFSGASCIRSAINTFGVCLSAPPLGYVALPGAIRGCRFSPPLWMKFLSAVHAVAVDVWINHRHILAHHAPYCKSEEKYCEIAARRLGQEVLC